MKENNHTIIALETNTERLAPIKIHEGLNKIVREYDNGSRLIDKTVAGTAVIYVFKRKD